MVVIIMIIRRGMPIIRIRFLIKVGIVLGLLILPNSCLVLMRSLTSMLISKDLGRLF